MNLRSEELSLHRARVLAALVSIVVAAGIALANLSSGPVTARLLDAKSPERAYGWPLVWYWRSARFIPGTIEFDWNGVLPDRVRWPVSRSSSSSLIANLAIWLLLLAASSIACEWLLRRYRPRLHWRPRLTMLLALILVSAPIVLANLSFDVATTRSWGDSTQRSIMTASFGWPFVWYWHLVVDSKVRGWDYSAARFAANLGTWLLMVALVGLTWEWLLRRYRPRLHWSLRTMLVAVALAAGLCAWCAAARNRAQEQDALTALAGDEVFFVERWGPKWLDLLGADPYRRRIVGAFLVSMQTEEDEEIFKRLARLPDLRFFEIDGHRWTLGETPAALDGMRGLQTLCIYYYGYERIAHECLVWIGKQTRLERLEFGGWDEVNLRGDDLARLSGLIELKSLKLNVNCDKKATHECLAAIGKLTQLEELWLEGAWEFNSGDLAHLGGLTNLRLLTIEKHRTQDEGVGHECLAAVGKLTHLERLCLEGFEFRSHDLACLGSLTNLKSLMLPHVGFVEAGSETRESAGEPRGFAHLPLLARLETVDLSDTKVGDRDLRRLAAFPRLKSLNLSRASISDAGLTELAPLKSLEKLAIDLRAAGAPTLEPLIALKGLRQVHIVGLDFALAPKQFTKLIQAWAGRGDVATSIAPPGEIDALRRGLKHLRQSHPGIVIAGNYRALEEQGESDPSWLPDDDERHDRGFDHYFVQQCIEER